MIQKRTVQWSTAWPVMALAVMLAGCGGGSDPVLWNDMARLKAENSELTLKVQHLQEETTRLSEQVATLSGLDETVRLQDLDTLDKIRIGKRTGFYDLDEDGRNDTLTVYIEPLDTSQDYVKAAGLVEVQLWNLNAASDGAKLASWSLAPGDIKDHWGGHIFASYYRLTFPVADILSGQETELTVKVQFTDLLSGKTASDQITVSAQHSAH
jgi:hypothetical protein